MKAIFRRIYNEASHARRLVGDCIDGICEWLLWVPTLFQHLGESVLSFHLTIVPNTTGDRDSTDFFVQSFSAGTLMTIRCLKSERGHPALEATVTD